MPPTAPCRTRKKRGGRLRDILGRERVLERAGTTLPPCRQRGRERVLERAGTTLPPCRQGGREGGRGVTHRLTARGEGVSLTAWPEGVSLTAWPRGGKGCHSPLGREGSFALLVVEPAPASASASAPAPACRAPRGGDRRAGGGLAPDPVIGERQRLPPAALVAAASRHTAVAAAAW